MDNMPTPTKEFPLLVRATDACFNVAIGKVFKAKNHPFSEAMYVVVMFGNPKIYYKHRFELLSDANNVNDGLSSYG